MKILRKNKKSLNNFDQLNILNDLYRIPNYNYNRYSLSSKKSKTKTILLEKRSPNRFPQYIKLVKKINIFSMNSQEKNIYSRDTRDMNKFILSQTRNRNSIYTEKQILNTFNKNINETIDNELNNSILNSQYENNEIKTDTIKNNNRLISISPSHNSKKDDIKGKKSIINKEIEVEENNINDINNYNKKHKIRYLLSKNYCGKKIIKRKFIKSPSSKISKFNENNNKITYKKINTFKNNLKIINSNKNERKTFEERTIDDNCNNIDSTPEAISGNTEINRYDTLKRNLKKSTDENQVPTFPKKTPDIQKNIIKEEISLNKPNNINNIINNNNEIKIELNDLIFFEERLNDIIISINNTKNIFNINATNEIIEFFSFYYNSSLQNKFPLFFHMQNRIIIKSSFNINLFMIILLYHLSLNKSILIKAIFPLRKIFHILKINAYLMVRKIEIFFGEEFCQNNEIFFKVFNIFLKDNDMYDLKEKEIIEIINKNCISITKEIENILNIYRVVNNKYYSDFQEINMTISKLNENSLIDYFYSNLYNNNFKENALIQKKSNTHINTKNNNEEKILFEQTQDDKYLEKIIISYKKNKKIPPFLKLKNNKKYTLVLGLENTLVNIKIDEEGQMLCHLRPGLISFMNGLKPFYEIISFTKLSKDYSDIIIKEIEGNKKLFDYNLYREHCTLIGREFIKDISRIGRDMSKIIFVDGLKDNLRFHSLNGILIKPYNGKNDRDDKALFELKKLLILFFRLGYEDIRVAIKNYKKEIYYKITSGI